MTEIFQNVSDEAKEIAELSWRVASIQKNPLEAANFLTNVTSYYSNILTEEEVEFLQFYFKMQMEMMKE
jgi:hypothetical protein